MVFVVVAALLAIVYGKHSFEQNFKGMNCVLSANKRLQFR